METNKVPTSTSTTTVSATSAAINPLFDPVALQAAYFTAAQLHNQLQQNSHLATAVNTTAAVSSITTTTTNNIHETLYKTTSPSSSPPCLPSLFVNSDRLYSLLPPQLQSCLKQQQQSIDTSPAHHCSAFSPINTDLPGAATTTAPSLLAQPSSLPPIPPVLPIASSQQYYDLLLMQMQMATAAAAGFFPAAFNVLPPVNAAALGLLTPQFRMLQLSDPNFSPYSASNGIFTSDIMSKNVGDTTSLERSLLQAQINLLANGSSLSSAVNEQTCTNSTVSDMSPNGVTFSLIQQLNPSLNHNSSSHNNNNGSKQQRIQMKRPYDEMSILRSLCSENHTIERETEMICGKRSKIGVTDESGRRSLQKFTKACNSEKNQQHCLMELDNKNLSNGSSKSNKEKCVTFGLFDENSPDRHHPLNHRPPAMEARFLECMAAIALHSNIPLPIKDENMIRSASVNESKMEENRINGKSEKQKQSTNTESENSNRAELRSIPSSNQSKSCENTSIITITSNENKKCWPNSAIDEELCKELENYKDSDVPVIHAFVLPAKLSNSASSPVSDGECSQDLPCTTVPESVAVPVPILNTLLDRILQTMLDS
ncbi:hypothetical protein ACH3XW_40080 [Acanthocheilonema viteae]|uniref:Uncharacterized protein n=1 Tax=Acanthocheilonema viteae TaxID=6277 RepID=A0A498S538_ACAVI|nr:unnamed protein product [Acanthocheilonema viteae]